jgi:hypothetical protein
MGQNNRDDERSYDAAPASTVAHFIKSLQIERIGSGQLWRSGQSAALEDLSQGQAASANVDAASLVTFVDGVSGQQKQDVLNSTLLAQLAANRKHERERDIAGWYELFRSVLEQVGWVSQPVGQNGRALLNHPIGPGQLSAFPLHRVIMEEVRFAPVPVALRLLKPVLSEDDITVTKAALDRFQNLPDRDRRVVIFESSSHNSTSGNFQIEPVKISRDGTLLMTIAAFFFRTDDSVTRVLSFHFDKRNTQMFQARNVMALNETLYSRIRHHVIAQLGDQASALIDDLEIR